MPRRADYHARYSSTVRSTSLALRRAACERVCPAAWAREDRYLQCSVYQEWLVSFCRLAERDKKCIKLLLTQLHFWEVRRRIASCLRRLTVHHERTQSLYETLGQSFNRVSSMYTLAICPVEL